jgi:hypothetical protein
MRKTLSRKNLENAGDGEGSLHGTKGISRSLSNVRLNKTFGKTEADTYWYDGRASARAQSAACKHHLQSGRHCWTARFLSSDLT